MRERETRGSEPDRRGDYDENTPLRDALPTLTAAHPDRYASLGLADLCNEMHDALRTSRMPALLDSAFDALPEAKLTPAHAYRRLVRGRSERTAQANALSNGSHPVENAPPVVAGHGPATALRTR